MAEKPKDRKTPREASESAKQKQQSERFIEAAREVGVDESGKQFERSLDRLTKGTRSVKT